MYDPPTILALIQARMDELGISQTQLGQLAFGKPSGSAFQAIKAGSSPAVDRLEAMANALGMELYFGPRRSPGGLRDEPDEFAAPSATGSIYLPIPWVPMGRKAHLPPVAISRHYLDARRIRPADVRAFEPDHDWTGLGLGDVTSLIDVERTQVGEDNGLFAWSRGGRTYLGMVQRIGDNVACITPEDQRGARDLGPARALHVLGRVVFLGLGEAATPSPDIVDQ